MDLSPQQISAKHFDIVRRGFDPDAVSSFLGDVATRMSELSDQLLEANSRIGRLEEDLSSAQEAEEAVKMTFVAAAQAKQELIADAKRQADELVTNASADLALQRREAEQIRAEAQQAAEKMVADARREALQLISDGRRDAEQLARRIHSDHSEFTGTISVMRDAIAKIQDELVLMARGALEDLAAAQRRIVEQERVLESAAAPYAEVLDTINRMDRESAAAVATPEPEPQQESEPAPESEPVPAAKTEFNIDGVLGPQASNGQLLAALRSLND